MLSRTAILLLALVGAGASTGSAAGPDRTPGDVALLRPAELRAVDGKLSTRFEVRYGDHTIAGNPVWLRGYNGGLAGPVLRLRPGETLRVDMANRLPPMPCNRPRAGGLDDVPAIARAREEILVFQQVSYSAEDCVGEDGKDVRPPKQQKLGVACIETYENFGPGIWPHVKTGRGPDAEVDKGQLRHTTINGQVQPTVFARPGEVVRLRAVHAGVRETIHMSIWPYEGAEKTRGLMRRLDERVQGSARPSGSFEAEGLGRLVPLYELAADGIAFGRVDAVSSIELQPGYRSDVLARFEWSASS